MKSKQEWEKDRSATNWLTQPIYKIMVAGLVVLELLGKDLDGGMKEFIHVVLWIGLAAVVLINVVNLFSFFGNSKKDSLKNEASSDDQE
ncbi:MAG TPA: hypothetical protein VFJ43_14420 [Bacteroidia bacterium]|nr:hypothetical protein [Bacteroidia bacterium]